MVTISLAGCYDSLQGSVEYVSCPCERNLSFTLDMTVGGRATVEGFFRECFSLPGELTFRIETDQTCILSAIHDLKQVERVFGDSMGVIRNG